MDVFGGAPRFLAYPRTYTVPSGADAVLKCQIVGDPRPTVIWERDQTLISPSDRYHFVEEGDEYNLVIRQALLEDSGQYICKAKNPVGETYAAATLRVEEGEWDPENRPVFLVRPSSARVGRGDDVVFVGQLTGKPAPSVSWEKDGKKLSEIFESAHFSAGGQGEGWHHLKLFGARPPDAGVYLCRASNTYGEAMAAAVLLVDPAMEALTPTPSSSSRQPSALGLQNGEGQEGNRPHRERRHRGRPQERRADPGLERGPGAEDLPHPTKVRAFAVSQGKHAKFRCLVTGKPKPEIVWRKDGWPVTPDRRHLLYEDREGYFNLKVLYCKQRDRGLYTCAASNAAGQTLSSVLLHIKEPRIKFRSQLQDVEVKEREQAVLECEVPAESVPATWYLEDRKLQPSAKYVIEQWGTRRRLTIKDITMDDDGIYLCQMKDGGRSIAEVAVKGKIVKRLPRKLDVVEGENAAFCVDLDEDNVDVRWYKDGEPLSESHKTIIKSFGKTHILVFVNATLEDAGVITFVISESKSSSQLHVKPKRQTVPGAPENARLSSERPNTASLVWSPPGERGGTGAAGFVVERQELGSEEWVRCLTTEGSTAVEILGESVPAEARYRFRVCAVNKHGRGGVTEFPGAVHLVPVARIRMHLNDTTVCQEEDAEFAIELTAPVIGTWHMKGRQLQEGERISIQHSRSQHSLLIRRAKLEENEVEVTFVAHGVRDSAILFVKAVPLEVSLSPGMEKEQRVTALESIILSCELSRPSGQVRWVKDGEDLEASDRISLESCGQTRRLIVQSSQLSDSGQYTCDATDNSITFCVTVSEPPVRIVNTADDTKAEYLKSDRIVLNCELSRPSAEVKWYKNGLEVEGDANIVMVSHGVHRSLIIQSARIEDSGEYVCDTGDDSIFFDITVREPRATLRAAEDGQQTRYLCGETVVLNCEVSHSDAEVKWYKDSGGLEERPDVRMESEGAQRRLVIPHCSKDDSGVYVCEATGDSLSFTVTVTDLPVTIVSSCPSEVMVPVGAEVILWCQLSWPQGLVRWSRDGAELEPSERCRIEVEEEWRRLIIHPAVVEDQGTYVCRSANAMAVFKVTVSEPRVTLRAAEDGQQTRYLCGETVVLNCEVSHSDAEVKWYKDSGGLEERPDVRMESEGAQRRLVIPHCSKDDSGVYVCEATGDSLSFTVTVTEPPVCIIRSKDQLLDHKFLVSEEIRLECEVSRADAPAFWYKDGEKVTEDRRTFTRSEGTVRSLQVLDARLTDSGEYLCDAQDDSIVFRVLVVEPPVRVTRPTDRLLAHKFLVSENIHLECEVSRADALARWYKNGEKVAEDGRTSTRSEGTVRSLQVLGAQLTDSGEYLCDVRDDSVVFRVLVEEPLVRIIRPTDRLLDFKFLVSQEIHLECEVSWANALAHWYKDGEKVAEDRRTFTRSEGTVRSLRILGAQLTDSGKYLCDVRDDSVVFRVLVEEPPVRITRPTNRLLDRRFLVSEEIRLECEVSRADALTRWYKDGERVSEDGRTSTRSEGTVRSLQVLGAQLTDSGEYLCDVRDDSVVFQVLVEEPPVRITRPTDRLQDHKFLVSQEIRLECEVSRADTLARWYKDGKKVAEDGRTSTRSEGTVRSLQVLGAQLTDSGEYLCDVRDDSVVFRVLVKEPPVRITRPTERLMDHKFLVSEEIRLECEVSRADASTWWYKDGEKVAEDGRTSTRSEGTVRSLRVLGARLMDSGEYLCDVRDDSVVFRVLVEDPPVTILGSNKISEDRTFTESEVISMTCELSRSDVKVRWYRDGVELLNSDKVKIESRGLTRELLIFDSEPCDSGQYVCDAGSDKLTFKVTVAEAPVLFTNKGKLPEEVTVNENGKAVLAAIVSKEKASVTWYRHKEPVSAGEKNEMNCESRVHSLILKNVQKEDSGFYVCRSADDKMTFNVSMIELPLVFVRRLENTGVQRGSSVTLWCELNKARGDVVWLKDGAEVEPSRKRTIRAEGRLRSLTLSKAAPEDEGEYACKSKDDRTAARVSVSVPRVVEFISDLHNLTVLEGEVAKFKCMVSPEDVRLVWRVNGADVPPGSDKYLVSQNGLCHTLLVRDCRAGEVTRVTAEAEGLFSKASLQVQEAQIVFTKKMVGVAVEEFQDATFEVEVSCGAAEVQWMKQGVVIQAGPRFLLQSEGRLRRLTVLGTTVTDRGTYRCETLHDRTQGKLSVEPRRISLRKSLVDLDTFEKEAATFHVELSHPNVEGVWVKDGIRVKPCSKRRVSVEGTRHSLTLSDLTLEDTGTIAFQSNNIRCSARLTVREPPVTFTRQLKDLQVPETTVVTLECELSRPNVEVRWHKDDMEIKPSKSIRIYSMGRKRVMQLGRCGVEDSGIYSCDAGDNKTTARLEVYATILCAPLTEREVRIVKHLEDLEVRENDNAVFVCEVSHEGVKGEWLKDGERIKSNNTVKIRQEGTKHFLLICKVKAEDAGEIQFTAKSVESTAHLDINELPIKIVKPLRDKTALEKHKVILECKVSKPRARVRWYRGDEELHPTDKYEICSEDCYRKLVIHNVSFEDEDTYTCDAFDDISSAKVLVEEQAILMVKDLEDVEVRAPGGVEMECEVSVPVIRPPQWTLNGRLLQSGKGVRLENHGTVQRLVLSQTSPEMSGLVKFTAGKARSSARLTIKGNLGRFC
ncbi:obscurin-like protein 1 isoform X2 [Hypanus sabinus]|uniref:obscurin-like protein 1 isoform X2 n=1 Tax=Hypanus sabinus TaxID=79690 RepID=UPI0028C43151|nr:obscurin-like protein 1 isoform X2 [Hypanus sabinus]